MGHDGAAAVGSVHPSRRWSLRDFECYWQVPYLWGTGPTRVLFTVEVALWPTSRWLGFPNQGPGWVEPWVKRYGPLTLTMRIKAEFVPANAPDPF
jgi:hypothetical protein